MASGLKPYLIPFCPRRPGRTLWGSSSLSSHPPRPSSLIIAPALFLLFFFFLSQSQNVKSRFRHAYLRRRAFCIVS
ncbi:hypothetical protein M408DRAFT_120109 [Serendipita vermifera MAFF 305830]|uniref:Uncharacterized protein n=1 Tax=Serendipita vermifera MAFF 305830 TaxID=933852 RepID=A0A0C3BAR5_SERVB|nr:hypothetical protein M408DRAFT_120109 [Serendipita vermifera MAFF 305830]